MSYNQAKRTNGVPDSETVGSKLICKMSGFPVLYSSQELSFLVPASQAYALHSAVASFLLPTYWCPRAGVSGNGVTGFTHIL